MYKSNDESADRYSILKCAYPNARKDILTWLASWSYVEAPSRAVSKQISALLARNGILHRIVPMLSGTVEGTRYRIFPCIPLRVGMRWLANMGVDAESPYGLSTRLPKKL
jgi:hypothetical protein